MTISLSLPPEVVEEMSSDLDAILNGQVKILALQQANQKLVGALDMIRESLTGGNVQDLLYIINTALKANALTVTAAKEPRNE